MKESFSITSADIIRLGLKYWYLFIIFPCLTFTAIFFTLRQTHPTFRASALLLINEEEENNRLYDDWLLSELGVGQNTTGLQNEMTIISSSTVLKEVVQQMNLQNQYFRVDRFLDRALYGNSPVDISQWDSENGEAFTGVVRLKDDQINTFSLSFVVEDEDRVLIGEFGKPIHTPYGDLILTYNPDFRDNFPVRILATSVENIVDQISGTFEVELYREESSIVQLTLEDQTPLRAEEVLQGIIDVYNEKTVDAKNQVYQNSIDLINDRILLINEELTEAELDVENYKQKFNVVEMSAEAQLLLEQLGEIDRRIEQTKIQQTILNTIEEFLLKNREDFDFVPTNRELNNLTLTNQIVRFNELLAQRESLAVNLGPQHPDLLLVMSQLNNLRQTIIGNVQSIKSDLQVYLQSNTNQKENLLTRMDSLPKRERELVEFERRKSVKENLYVYLLQKREESAISMSVTQPKGVVVEPAKASSTPSKPNKKIYWLSAICLGFAIPMGVVLLLDFFDDKIESEADLKHLTAINQLGSIAKVSEKHLPVVVNENKQTHVAELFRMLRSNLNFVLTGSGSKCLLVASCVSGEGKSFISLNLAMVFAMSGKKVVLIRADLRKPDYGTSGHHHRSNGKALSPGLVNYLIDESLEVDDVISPSEFHPNLDVLSTGPKPPNPGELIISPRVNNLVDLLRKRYDYIIIDSPPLGIVADAQELSEQADATLLVARAHFTTKRALGLLDKISRSGKLPKPAIVLNGVTGKDYKYGKYLYGYSYVKPEEGYYQAST